MLLVKILDERCHVTIALGTATGGWTLSVNGLDGLALAGIGVGMLSLGLAGAIGDGQCSSCLRAQRRRNLKASPLKRIR
jgi:hypothetical protein